MATPEGVGAKGKVPGTGGEYAGQDVKVNEFWLVILN